VEALGRDGWVGANNDMVCLPLCVRVGVPESFWLQSERYVVLLGDMGGVIDCLSECFE